MDEEVDAVLWSGLCNDEALFSSFTDRYELEPDMLAPGCEFDVGGMPRNEGGQT